LALTTIIFDLGGTLIEYAGNYDKWPDLETPGFHAAYDFLEDELTLPPFAHFRDTGFALLPLLWRQAQLTEANFQVVDLLAATLRGIGARLTDATAVSPGLEFPVELVAAAAAQYTTAIQTQAAVMPHAVETVAAIKAEGFKIGLISNTMFPGSAHQADLVRFGLADYFDTMVFSADENKWKPTPAPFLHALDVLQENGAAAVYIGDDPASDVVGAHAAGMKAIYFQSSHRFQLPDGVIPDGAIHTLPELLKLLASWG
jgi:putative hydrolase of the HAD superfamily